MDPNRQLEETGHQNQIERTADPVNLEVTCGSKAKRVVFDDDDDLVIGI